MADTIVGQRIREARSRTNMSQQQLALSIGVSDKTVSAYEIGRVDPPIEILRKISKTTQHPIGYFLGEIQSSIEAKLDRIANELKSIRTTIQQQQQVLQKNTFNAKVTQAPEISTQSVNMVIGYNPEPEA